MSNADLTFAAFAAINRERCENDFHRTLDDTNDHTIETWAAKMAVEAGEVLEAVLRFGGKLHGKDRATAADIGAELADVVSYCDLLASRLGLSLGDALVAKWNRVSERVGSTLRIPVEPVDPSMPPPDVIEAMAKDCRSCATCGESPPCSTCMAGGVCHADCTCQEDDEDERNYHDDVAADDEFARAAAPPGPTPSGTGGPQDSPAKPATVSEETETSPSECIAATRETPRGDDRANTQASGSGGGDVGGKALACLLKIVEVVNSPSKPTITFRDDDGMCALTASYGTRGCHEHMGAGPRLMHGRPEDAAHVAQMVDDLLRYLAPDGCDCKERKAAAAEAATEALTEDDIGDFMAEQATPAVPRYVPEGAEGIE